MLLYIRFYVYKEKKDEKEGKENLFDVVELN